MGTQEDVESVEQCAILQEDELSVLESIYPGQITVHPNPSGKSGKLLTINIPISLPFITDVELCHTSQGSTSSSASLVISHLPPLSLRLLLPALYPSVAPKPTDLRAPMSSSNAQPIDWLSRSVLKRVKDKMIAMWEEERELFGEGVGVIWKWWEWAGSGDFLLGQDLKSSRLELTVPPMLPPSTFHTFLKTHNAAQIHSSFESTAFSCSICFENRKGKSCIEMPCGCVFCTPCLTSCWTLAITEGTLDSVSCPSITCTKSRATKDRAQEGTETDPMLVETVVGKPLRDRWERLKERRKAEIDPTYTVCPRPTCQASVPPPVQATSADLEAQSHISKRAIRLSDLSNSQPSTPTSPSKPSTANSEDRWARYRLCPTCGYSFCLYCSATWHGPHTICSFPSTSLIVQEYLSHPEGSEHRKRMEIQKGKVNLDRMLEKFYEDEENKKWMNERTRACAGCGVRVEKSHGCNHMTCGRCSAHFCYRCGDSDPYAHYRRPGHPCFEKLFDQEEIARFERETAQAGGGNAGFVGAAGDDEFEDWRDVRGFWQW